MQVERVEVLTDTAGVDLQPYLTDRALPLIRANWYQLVSKSGERTGGDATLQFTVLKDGTVKGVKLVDGEGHATLADLAINAVERSGPLPALPQQFAAQSVDMRLRFEYAASCDANMEPIAPISTCQGGTAGCVVAPRIALPSNSENIQQGAAKYSGTVSLRLIVNTEGKPENITVVKSLGPGLDQKAIDAVRNWKFEPAMKDGKPIAAQIVVEVDFHLYDKDESKPAKQ